MRIWTSKGVYIDRAYDRCSYYYISILSTLALPRFQRFQAQAKLTEMTVNMRSFETLHDTALLDLGANDRPTNFATGFGHDNGSGNPANSCNITNPIGFVLNNCKKVNFEYANNSSSFVAGASGSRIYSICPSNWNFALVIVESSREKLYAAGPGVNLVDGVTGLLNSCN